MLLCQRAVVRQVMKSNLFIIAKKGWLYLAYSISIFILLTIVDLEFFAFFAFLITLFFIFVFRNPERELVSFEPNSILSPADGIVSSITTLKESEYAYRVDIQSNYFDVSLLRSPMNATVESVITQEGTRVSQDSILFNDLNENSELVFIDENKNRVKVVHRIAQSFAPLCIDVIGKQALLQTSRYGLMLNGTTSIYLPSNVRVNVNVGNEVKASQTLLAHIS